MLAAWFFCPRDRFRRSISAIDFGDRFRRSISLSVRRAGSPTVEFYYFIKAHAAPASTIVGDQFVGQFVAGPAWFF
jgi:hypothetical protein